MQSASALSSSRTEKENTTTTNPASLQRPYSGHHNATVSLHVPELRPNVTNATVPSASACMPSVYSPLRLSDVACLSTPYATADSFFAFSSSAPQNRDNSYYVMTDAERGTASRATRDCVAHGDSQVLAALHELHSDVATAAAHTSVRRAAWQAQSQECYDTLVALEERVRLAEQRCHVVEAEAQTRAQAAMRDAAHVENSLARLQHEETVAALRVRAATERADAAEARAAARQSAVDALEQQLRSRTELAYSHHAKLIADAELDAKAARGRLQVTEAACTAAEARTRQAIAVAEEAERTTRARLAATQREHEARMLQLTQEEQRCAAAITTVRRLYAEETAQQQQQRRRCDEVMQCRDTGHHMATDGGAARVDEGTPYPLAGMHDVKHTRDCSIDDDGTTRAPRKNTTKDSKMTAMGHGSMPAGLSAEVQRNDIKIVCSSVGQPCLQPQSKTVVVGAKATVPRTFDFAAGLHAQALVPSETTWPELSAPFFTTARPPRSSWLPYVNTLTRAYEMALQRATSHWAWMLDAALETMQRKVEVLLLATSCAAAENSAVLSHTC